MTPGQLENALEAQLRHAQAPGLEIGKIKPPKDLWENLAAYCERHPKATFAPSIMEWLSKNETLSIKQWEAVLDMFRKEAKEKVVVDLSASTLNDSLRVPNPDNFERSLLPFEV
jgi:hypothetical protein